MNDDQANRKHRAAWQTALLALALVLVAPALFRELTVPALALQHECSQGPGAGGDSARLQTLISKLRKKGVSPDDEGLLLRKVL